MILFLEFRSKGHRGGEVYHQHLHKFLKENYQPVQPDTLVQLPDKLLSRFARIKYAYKLVDKYNPELIVSDISSSALNFAAISRAKKRGAKLLLIVQGERDLSSTKSWMRKKFIGWAERYVVGKADILLANSKYSADRIKSIYKKELSTVVAYPGIEINQLSPERDVNKSDRIKLLFVGECSQVKGLIYLIKAMAKIENNKISLDIAGGWSQEHDYYMKVCSLIKSNNLESRIKWHGFVDSETLSDLYINSDILVAPSLSEGYGMVVAEAITFGLPVIASAVGGIREVIGDSESALLVEPANPNEMADAIDKAMSNNSLRKKMSMGAFEHSTKLSTWVEFHHILKSNLSPYLPSIIKTP